jgi:hypothetical protein
MAVPSATAGSWPCEHVADDVNWTVEGTHPLAGHSLSKQAFLDATFARLDGVLSGGVHLEVVELAERLDGAPG